MKHNQPSSWELALIIEMYAKNMTFIIKKSQQVLPFTVLLSILKTKAFQMLILYSLK